MGIFTSFATGFVEGSVQKMKDEAAAREADRLAAEQRRTKLGETVFDLIKSGNLTGAQGAAFLQNEDATLADLAAMSKTVEDAENSTRVGNIILPFSVGYGKDEDVFNSVNQMEQYLIQNGDTLAAELDRDANTKKAFTGLMASLYNANNLFHHKKFSVKDTERGIYTSHAYRDYSKGLANFERFAKELGVIQIGNFVTVPDVVGQVEMGEGEYFIPQSYSTSEGSVQGVIVSGAGLEQDFGTNAEMISSLASHHGMPQGGRQVFANVDYMTYGEDEKATAEQLSADDKMRSIAYGAQLISVGAASMLLLEGGATEQTKDASVRIFNEVGNGSADLNYIDEDVGAMRRAAFTIVKPESVYASAPPNLLTEIDGTQYAINQKIDVAGFRDQASATDEAVDMLRELRQLQGTYKTTGLSAKLERFVLGVAGQATQASELFFSKDISDPALFQDNLGVNKDGTATNAASLLESARAVLGEDRIKQMSRIDALRLTLAAKMARAVDPSGRLSNQDFEIQLERLGGAGWFTTQTGAMEKLDTVLAEFEKRQAEQKDLKTILGKPKISVEDRRFIRATHLVNNSIRHRKKMENMAAGLPDTPAPAALEEAEFDTTGLVDLGDGYFYNETEQKIMSSAGVEISSDDYAKLYEDKGNQ